MGPLSVRTHIAIVVTRIPMCGLQLPMENPTRMRFSRLWGALLCCLHRQDQRAGDAALSIILTVKPMRLVGYGTLITTATSRARRTTPTPATHHAKPLTNLPAPSSATTTASTSVTSTYQLFSHSPVLDRHAATAIHSSAHRNLTTCQASSNPEGNRGRCSATQDPCWILTEELGSQGRSYLASR